MSDDPEDPEATESPTSEPHPAPSGTHLLGLLLAGAAALLLLLAITALNWLSSGGLSDADGRPDSTFTGLRTLLRLADESDATYSRFVAHQYFTWGAWVLLAVVIVAAALGNVLGAAGRNGRGFGVLAVVVGVAGAALTFAAIDLIGGKRGLQVPAYSDYLGHLGPAFFCAVAGFVVAAVSGVAATRRPTPRRTPPRRPTPPASRPVDA